MNTFRLLKKKDVVISLLVNVNIYIICEADLVFL